MTRLYRATQLALLSAIVALLGAIYVKMPPRPPTVGEWHRASSAGNPVDPQAIYERMPVSSVFRVEQDVGVDIKAAELGSPLEVEVTNNPLDVTVTP